jgi:hypothetical protein
MMASVFLFVSSDYSSVVNAGSSRCAMVAVVCYCACRNKVHSLQQLPDLQAQPFFFKLMFARPILVAETEANANTN